VSLYCFDPQRQVLSVSWLSAGQGRLSHDVAFDGPNDATQVEPLVRALNELTTALWRCYDLPASAVIGDDTAEQQRQAEEDALSTVSDVVRTPNRPSPSGGLLVSYVAVEEHAHRVGRALDAMPPSWRAAVADDLDVERHAVYSAALGDYSERGVQAVWRDRVEVTPGPLHVAVRMLAESDDPVATCVSLPATVGVMAANAAGSTLLLAAADVAAGIWGGRPAAVFAESDNIEACSIAVPSQVVDALHEGSDPIRLVSDLVHDAVRVRQGWVPNIDALFDDVRDASQRGEQHEDRWPGITDTLRHEASRLTPLDTERPAADLFEHILDGIGAAWTLFNEFIVDESSAELPEPDETDPDSEDEWSRRMHEISWTKWLDRLRDSYSTHVAGFDFGMS
jgi:hypothetical protein